MTKPTLLMQTHGNLGWRGPVQLGVVKQTKMEPVTYTYIYIAQRR